MKISQTLFRNDLELGEIMKRFTWGTASLLTALLATTALAFAHRFANAYRTAFAETAPKGRYSRQASS
jgi:hypothetical protein